MEAKVWLVYPHDFIGSFIDTMEGPGKDVSHAAILLPDEMGRLWVYEAVGQGFRKIDPSLYDGIKLEEYTINLPTISGSVNKAESLIGTEYSKLSCVEGFIKMTTGLEVSQNSQSSVNCSESVVIIIRRGDGCVCDDTPPSCITPSILKQYFLSVGIKGELKNG